MNSNFMKLYIVQMELLEILNHLIWIMRALLVKKMFLQHNN